MQNILKALYEPEHDFWAEVPLVATIYGSILNETSGVEGKCPE